MSLRNLLNADFARLVRSRLFWISLAASAALGMSIELDFKDDPVSLILISVLLLIYVFGVFPPLFCAIFAGKDLSDGLAKNRIAVGAKRHNIYISLTAVCSAALYLNYAVFELTGMLCIAITEKMAPIPTMPNYLLSMACVVFICFSLTAILMLPVAALRRKTAAVAICIMIMPVLLVCEMSMFFKLSKPEFETHIYEYSCDGSEQKELIPLEKVLEMYPDAEVKKTEDWIDVTVTYPNEEYIGGARRAIYGFAEKFLPFGQIIKLPRADDPADAKLLKNVLSLAARSACTAAFFTAVGVLLFKRKNIN